MRCEVGELDDLGVTDSTGREGVAEKAAEIFSSILNNIMLGKLLVSLKILLLSGGMNWLPLDYSHIHGVAPTFYKNKNFVHIGVHIKMHIKL
jgi:hypothetical protein